VLDSFDDSGLLIAAHGEQQPGAQNECTKRIAEAISARKVVAEVTVGFIKGHPTIGEALSGLSTSRVIIYPLFASNGYFTRDRLVQILDGAECAQRTISILSPFGLDPGLPALLLKQADRTARASGLSPDTASIILLAHGSRRNSASREATERIATSLRQLNGSGRVETAFLEEQPFFNQTAARVGQPAVVLGLFSGEGLHGAADAKRLVADFGWPDVVYAGPAANYDGVDGLIASAVTEHVRALARKQGTDAAHGSASQKSSESR
jgi:sirohydrochlorin ferrochelatase